MRINLVPSLSKLIRPTSLYQQVNYSHRIVEPIAELRKKLEKENVIYYSLQERLDMENDELKNPEKYHKVDIGLSYEVVLKGQKKSQAEKKKLEKVTVLKKHAIDIDQCDKKWREGARPNAVRLLAEHFHIFQHLFGNQAYFYPVVHMNIEYDFDEDSVSPVYFGNLLKPRETSKPPKIEFDCKPEELYTLLFINPDGNLYCNESELLHWFVGNIPGNDISKGEEIIDYLQPIPPKGSGYHRCVFVLYKQNEKIDFSKYQKQAPCISLKDRNFYNYCFYKEFEQSLTPAGLSWFQVDYDFSLTEVFHKKLQMKEPIYEYSFNAPFIAKFSRNPGAIKSFHDYLDRYRDPKEINKEVLEKRLSMIDPLKGDVDLPKYPHVLRPEFSQTTPIWLQKDFQAKADGGGKYKQLYKFDRRPKVPVKHSQRVHPPKWVMSETNQE